MSGQVHFRLDPGTPYGIACYGRTRSEYVSIRPKKRRVQPAPRHEWTAIPVSLEGGGLERGRVERARQTIESNRAPAKVGNRE